MRAHEDYPPPFRTEAAGWLAFVLFVACVYALRRLLNRSAPQRS